MIVSGKLRYGTVAEFSESAKQKLLEIHSFREFSRASYAILEKVVDDSGHRFAFGATESLLPQVFDEREFLAQLSTFDERFILRMTFLQMVDVFEHWLYQVLRAVLAHPHRVMQTKSISPRLVLSAKTIEEAKFRIVDTELYGVIHGGPTRWFDFIGQKLKVELPDKDKRDSIREIKATRDVWVHNDGYANDLYFKKAGTKARVEQVINARPEITPEYHSESWKLILDFINVLGASLSDRFDKQILSFYS